MRDMHKLHTLGPQFLQDPRVSCVCSHLLAKGDCEPLEFNRN